MKSKIRYFLLMLWYFRDDTLLLAKSKRMTKPLYHASIVVNRLNSTRLELIRVAEVLTYFIIAGASVITVHDVNKTLHIEKRLIEQFMKKKLEQGLQRRGGSLNIDNAQESTNTIINL